MSEIYIGTKFSSTQISKQNPEHKKIKVLEFWCSYFHNFNLAPPYPGGSSGNLSFRLSDKNDFIITASNTRLSDDMPNEYFCKVTHCDLNNFSLQFEGKKIPSSESLMHYAIYKERPDINAIFHGHSPKILQDAHILNIPTTKNEEEYGTAKLIKNVLEIINLSNVIIMKNHGFITMGENIETAGNNIVEIINKINR